MQDPCGVLRGARRSAVRRARLVPGKRALRHPPALLPPHPADAGAYLTRLMKPGRGFPWEKGRVY